MSNEQCARCDGHLGTANRNPDKLCGPCQRELGAHNPNSRAYAAWISHGKRREIHRTAGGTPMPSIGAPEPFDAVVEIDLSAVKIERLIDELRRRRELLRIVPNTDARH